MKFVCGNCKELIRSVVSSRNIRSWQPHEKCGYETEFDNFVPGMQKGEPVALRTRKIEKKPEQKQVKQSDGKPTAADLDKDAKEKEVVTATSGQAKK